jgi:hypothetical protein
MEAMLGNQNAIGETHIYTVQIIAFAILSTIATNEGGLIETATTAVGKKSQKEFPLNCR